MGARPDSAKTWGPSEYDPEKIRSGVLKTKSSFISTKFGTAERKTPAHQSDAPDKLYDVPGGLGSQLESSKSSSPIIGFGMKTQIRSGSVDVPGPGAYKPDIGCNKPNSVKNIKFGSSTRPPLSTRGPTIPGPAKYKTPGAMGKQVSSNYKSSPGARVDGTR